MCMVQRGIGCCDHSVDLCTEHSLFTPNSSSACAPETLFAKQFTAAHKEAWNHHPPPLFTEDCTFSKLQQLFLALLAGKRFWRQHCCLFLSLLLLVEGLTTVTRLHRLFNLAQVQTLSWKAFVGAAMLRHPDNARHPFFRPFRGSRHSFSTFIKSGITWYWLSCCHCFVGTRS